MKKRNNNIFFVFVTMFLILFLFFGYIYSIIFFRQAHFGEYSVGDTIRYLSDMPVYIDIVNGIETVYKVTYPIFFDFSRFLTHFVNANDAVALSTLFLNMLCIPILTIFFWNYIDDQKSNLGRFIAILLPYVVLFSSMLWIPKGNIEYGIARRYLGVFSPNPLHNQTYLAARPFAILAFIFWVKIIDYYEEKYDVKDYIIFSVTLLLATMTKPSFTVVLGSVALPFLLCRLIFHNFKTFKRTIVVGLCFLPTIINLLFQYSSMFRNGNSESENGIGFSFLRVWHLYSQNVPLSLFLTLAFPIVILLFNINDFMNNRAYRFSWEFLLAGSLEFMLLTESGSRLAHANFCWGYMYGLFFIFMMSSCLLLKSTVSKKNHVIVIGIEWFVLFLHLICGTIYFLYMLNGGDYTQF